MLCVCTSLQRKQCLAAMPPPPPSLSVKGASANARATHCCVRKHQRRWCCWVRCCPWASSSTAMARWAIPASWSGGMCKERAPGEEVQSASADSCMQAQRTSPTCRCCTTQQLLSIQHPAFANECDDNCSVAAPPQQTPLQLAATGPTAATHRTPSPHQTHLRSGCNLQACLSGVPSLQSGGMAPLKPLRLFPADPHGCMVAGWCCCCCGDGWCWLASATHQQFSLLIASQMHMRGSYSNAQLMGWPQLRRELKMNLCRRRRPSVSDRLAAGVE